MANHDQGELKHAGKRVGTKLRNIRQERKMSLEELANATGVSRLTLGQIERGEANPTLMVLWKIANGLSIPVTALLSDQEVLVARKDQGLKLVSTDEVFVVEPLFSAPAAQSFEMYRAQLKANSKYHSEAHPAGVVEFVTVMSGTLQVEVQGEIYELTEHESIRFHADHEHTYINATPTPVTIHFVIAYNGTAGSGSVIFGGNKM